MTQGQSSVDTTLVICKLIIIIIIIICKKKNKKQYCARQNTSQFWLLQLKIEEKVHEIAKEILKDYFVHKISTF